LRIWYTSSIFVKHSFVVQATWTPLLISYFSLISIRLLGVIYHFSWLVSNMDLEKSNALFVKFNEKNYALWKFIFQTFIESKNLSRFLNGSMLEVTNDKEKNQYKTKNTQVITWILNSVDQYIILSLRPFKTVSDIWKHLLKICCQTNQSTKFDIESEISKINQEDKDIKSFYVELKKLWHTIWCLCWK